MINRRRALAAIGIAAVTAGELSTNSTIYGAELAAAADSTLRADIARVSARVYSEEGVPMFLACESLTAVKSAPKERAISAALNQKVASAFLRYAGEWQQIHPDAPPGDVVRILELIADRDFASGGTEPSL